MPFLSRKSEAWDAPEPRGWKAPWDVPALDARFPLREGQLSTGLFRNCANTSCESGWLHLLRSRSVPVFEGGWTCSAACTAVRVAAALRRELDGKGVEAPRHPHRVPLGLVMLEQGWITAEQLRQALAAQRAAGAGRLGQWLVERAGVSERQVTRALGVQWSCPVFPVDGSAPEALTSVMPRVLIDAFGALPLRIAAGKLLYLGYEDRLDPAMELAVERMTGLRVESGLVDGSLFRAMHRHILNAGFPPAELIEAASERALALTLTKAIENLRPAESRLVRVHECLWLRLWLCRPSGPISFSVPVHDMICSIGMRISGHD